MKPQKNINDQFMLYLDHQKILSNLKHIKVKSVYHTILLTYLQKLVIYILFQCYI